MQHTSLHSWTGTYMYIYAITVPMSGCKEIYMYTCTSTITTIQSVLFFSSVHWNPHVTVQVLPSLPIGPLFTIYKHKKWEHNQKHKHGKAITLTCEMVRGVIPMKERSTLTFAELSKELNWPDMSASLSSFQARLEPDHPSSLFSLLSR